MHVMPWPQRRVWEISLCLEGINGSADQEPSIAVNPGGSALGGGAQVAVPRWLCWCLKRGAGQATSCCKARVKGICGVGTAPLGG